MSNVKSTSKVLFFTKLGYGLTDGSLLMISLTLAVHIMYFYTDVVGIPAVTVGTMFMVARIWDAVNDPLLGSIVDKTNTQQGKFRPFIFIGGIPLLIATVLCFTNPKLSIKGNIIYMYITYIFWGMAYTTIYIPYSAMVSSLSQNPQERASISAIKSACATIGMLVTSVLAVPLVMKLGKGNESLGYQRAAVIFILIALLMFIITFKTTKKYKVVNERKDKTKFTAKQMMSVVFSNKPLLCIVIATLFMFFKVFISNSAGMYFFKYSYGDMSKISIYLGLGTGSMFIGAITAPMVSKRLGKKKTYLMGGTISTLAGICMYVFRLTNFKLFLLFSVINGIFFSFPYAIMYGMVADTVEYGEWKTGIRAEGIIYSSVSFVNKLAAGVMGVATGVILDYFGYIPNTKQTVSALFGIDMIAFILPIIFTIFMIIPMLFYNLDNKKFEEIINELNKKNS